MPLNLHSADHTVQLYKHSSRYTKTSPSEFHHHYHWLATHLAPYPLSATQHTPTFYMTIILGMMHLEYKSTMILQNVGEKNSTACQNT